MVLDVWKSIKRKEIAPLYLLFGNEPFLINETKRLIVEHALNEEELDFNLSQFDLEEIPVEKALEEAETLPFMGEKRVVFLHNPVFLTTEKSKSKVEHQIASLERYIQNPAPYSVIVLSAPYEKLDERKKITKELKRRAVVVETKKLNEQELKSWVHDKVRAAGKKMDEEALRTLLELAGTNLMLLNSEVDKMLLYIGQDDIITKETVELLVSKSLEQNVFTLVELVIQRRISESVSMLQDLLNQNEEPIKILSIMAGQLRLLYQVKELANQGYGQQRIATLLKVHPFRIKLALEKVKEFKTDELLYLMNQLADADYKMKTGGMDKALLLELLFLKLSK
ncbi:DNA polymerase III subunit delta [Peribacillus tepidiphilus]|uniref:DNA polymerase III subunit delta n=1 Tax=Peribacillus tepidiphilus TaxID=2652445 RepID=UPI001291EE41|nr:DNA polymerase III subunit delta [Peribacillus tepidiphilus]